MIQRKDTKTLLGESIIDLMKKKQLEKIKVSDITKNCMMCRENFYYHFNDKYDLIRWIYEHQIYTKTVSDFKGSDMQMRVMECCSSWVNYFKENREFVQNALQDNHPKGFRSIITDATFNIMTSHLESCLGPNQLSKEMSYYMHHYTFGIVNMAEDWIRRGMADSDKFIIEVMLRSLPADLKKIYSLDEKYTC